MVPDNGAATVMSTLAVIMTCHNRVNKTLACLARLFDQDCPRALKISVYLVDDGSTDGTGKAVKSKYPGINVIYGDGDLFWNRGMHLAFGEALKTNFDYYLWLNDDTLLYPGALTTMMKTHRELTESGRAASIIVASTQDPATGKFTYGGYIRAGKFINPLRLRLQPPQEAGSIGCDTMCGNCVLIPKQVTDVIGNIDPEYMHRWGDVDYGLRAKAANCESYIAPGYLADCEGNPNADKHRDHNLPFMQRLKELHSLKGLGKKDWLRFVRTHGGTLWIGVWVRPYLRLIYNTFR
jgi:GT2 family glycosyltransferase